MSLEGKGGLIHSVPEGAAAVADTLAILDAGAGDGRLVVPGGTGLLRAEFVGKERAEKLRREILTLIQKEPLAGIDYVSVADNETLDELETVKPPAIVSVAVKIGKTRLIDNIVLL